MINAPRAFPLPGTVPGQLVALQVRAFGTRRSVPTAGVRPARPTMLRPMAGLAMWAAGTMVKRKLQS